MLNDFRHAARTLGRAPGFTGTAIVTLALGIGSVLAVFTVVNDVLLTPPPYARDDRLVVLSTPDGGSGGTAQELTFVRDRSRTLVNVTAQQDNPGWNLVSGTYAEFVTGLEVADGYFEAHGVALLRGRGISAAEARVGGERTVVISDALWQRVFDARTDVLGQVVSLGGRVYTVVGVAPGSFRSNPEADLWTPLQIPATSNAANLRIMARVAETQTIATVNAELETIREELRAAVTSRQNRVAFLSWRAFQDWFRIGRRAPLLLLLGAVGLLLLVACANVSGLQLAHGLARTSEFATRAALGAARSRLIREALAEATLLATLGSALGLAVAALGVRGFEALIASVSTGSLPSGQPPSLTFPVLFATTGLAAFCTVVSGLAPALFAARIGLATGFDMQRSTVRGVRLRRVLTVTQLTSAIVLLIGSGLLIRSFASLLSASLGFNPSGVIVGAMAVQGEPMDIEQRQLFFARSLDRFRTIEGVEDVAFGSAAPIDRALNLPVMAQNSRFDDPRSTDFAYVSPNYFDVLAAPTVVGRSFNEDDVAGTLPVAIVNEAFARTFYGRTTIVGETLSLLGVNDGPREIVGVVGDMKTRSNAGWTRSVSALGSAGTPMLFIPAAQVSPQVAASIHTFTDLRWIVKALVIDDRLERALTDAARAANPAYPFKRFSTIDQLIGEDIALPRVLAATVTLFGISASFLAALGLYGLLSYLQLRRAREFGIRQALGATGVGILRVVIREGLGLVALGIGCGATLSILLARSLTTFLTNVSPFDPLSYTGAMTLLLLSASTACIVPALRAARQSPSVALRTE